MPNENLLNRQQVLHSGVYVVEGAFIGARETRRFTASKNIIILK